MRYAQVFKSSAVLLVADLFHPFDVLTVKRLLNGDMRQSVGRGSAVPMFHARRRPYDIALPDLLLYTALLLHPADARRDYQDLAKRMCMPCGARARFECDTAAGHPRRRVYGEESFDAHIAGELRFRASAGRPGAASSNGHLLRLIALSSHGRVQSWSGSFIGRLSACQGEQGKRHCRNGEKFDFHSFYPQVHIQSLFSADLSGAKWILESVSPLHDRFNTTSFRLRPEQNGISLDKFEGLDHLLCTGFVFFEMKRFQMRLVRIRISIHLKNSDVGRITLYRYGV
jgi:hypothetical protein